MEIPFRTRKCTNYMMIDTLMSLRTLKLLWPRGIHVTSVTLYDKTHKCDKAYFLCTATPTYFNDQSKYRATCNRWFLSEKCFQNLSTLKVIGKLVCQWRQVCRNCSFTVTSDYKHECFKRFCKIPSDVARPPSDAYPSGG